MEAIFQLDHENRERQLRVESGPSGYIPRAATRHPISTLKSACFAAITAFKQEIGSTLQGQVMGLK